jgi:hypothetical protein
MSKATWMKPLQVATQVKSVPHSMFGLGILNRQFTLLSGQGRNQLQPICQGFSVRHRLCRNPHALAAGISKSDAQLQEDAHRGV